MKVWLGADEGEAFLALVDDTTHRIALSLVAAASGRNESVLDAGLYCRSAFLTSPAPPSRTDKHRSSINAGGGVAQRLLVDPCQRYYSAADRRQLSVPQVRA